MAGYVRNITAAAFTDPDLAVGQNLVLRWDLQADPESTTAAVMMMGFNLPAGNQQEAPPQLAGTGYCKPGGSNPGIFESGKTAQGKIGRLDAPWGQVNRLVRGSVDLAVGGGPDLLHATYGDIQPDGRIKNNTGDLFVQLVKWDKLGQVSAFGIHQFGSATLDFASPHFADQSALFARRQLKPAWFRKWISARTGA